MATTYMVIKSDPASGLFEGQKVTSYFEDSNEIIINGPRPDTDHHIRKNSNYYTEHLQPIGGNR